MLSIGSPWNVGCNISNPEKMTSNTRKQKNPNRANVELIGFENIVEGVEF
jgi:hypothetical protein